MLEAIIRGIKKGLNTVWVLSKVIIPVFIIVSLLKDTFIMKYITMAFEPMMSFVGLPGEASTVLVLGLFVNIYAALGAIISLSLTAKQITIIAIFLSFAHTLPVEVEITKKVGAPRKLILTVRLVSGILGAFITNLIL